MSDRTGRTSQVLGRPETFVAFLDAMIELADRCGALSVEFEQSITRFIVSQGGRPDDVDTSARRLMGVYLNATHNLETAGHFLLGVLVANRRHAHHAAARSPRQGGDACAS